MSKTEKMRTRVLLGDSDANIDFGELCKLMISLEFSERIKGSHHIFSKSGVEEIINIQPKGSKAEACQVKQIRNVILNYRLGASDE